MDYSFLMPFKVTELNAIGNNPQFFWASDGFLEIKLTIPQNKTIFLYPRCSQVAQWVPTINEHNMFSV